MTVQEADGVLENIESGNFVSLMQFVCWFGTQTVGTFFQQKSWHEERNRGRGNWFVACEMEVNNTNYGVYYVRVLKLLTFEVDEDHYEKWPHWQKEYDVAILDWTSGLHVGEYGQVYKGCTVKDAFSTRTLEDIYIIRRLVSVVDHELPHRTGVTATNQSWISSRSGRKRCYFIDNCFHGDGLLSESGMEKIG